jgi:glucosamine--fructose-6-phosphate aminotransferase (isomerizing)
VRGIKYGDEITGRLHELEALPEAIAVTLAAMEPVRELAGGSRGTGRPCSSSAGHVGYTVALEGALKLKELAYMHARASPPASSSTARSP